MLCPIMHILLKRVRWYENYELGLICDCYHTRSVNLRNDEGSFVVSFIFIGIWLDSVIYEYLLNLKILGRE